jgi:predicted CopG family antitoxin
MKMITLEVSDPVAEKVARMTPAEKKTFSDTVDRILLKRKSLSEIMHEATEQARKNGLTSEILEELLKEK